MRAENSASAARYDRPFRTRAAAEWLGISERQLLEFARTGAIKARKIGGIWLFSQKALAEFAGVDE